MPKDKDTETQHKKAMQAVQQEVRQAVARAREKRGIVIYLYGNGKGKSSSAFGTLLRALGHDQRVAVVQFIKGKWKTGEEKFLKSHPQISYYSMDTGFTWDSQNKAKDMAAAQKTYQHVERVLADENIDLVVLDEITYMFDFDYLPLEPFINALKMRPKQQNVIITGRTAITALVELADTVSEVREIKHAFNIGVKAQKGIEF